VGAVRLGALNVYRAVRGPLTGEQHADAMVVADVTARWVLEGSGRSAARRGGRRGGGQRRLHFAVHNAAGIVSVQESIRVTDALIRLQGYAFSADRLLADVARDVIPAGSGGNEHGSRREQPATSIEVRKLDPVDRAAAVGREVSRG
jgi:hypothetical protein